MNLVIPEWIFIDPTADTVFTISTNGLDGDEKFRGEGDAHPVEQLQGCIQGDAVHRIINDTAKKRGLIRDVIKILERNNFIGVNVDFEELQEKKNETLVKFQKDIYERLHAKKFPGNPGCKPFNEDYNFKELAKYMTISS